MASIVVKQFEEPGRAPEQRVKILFVEGTSAGLVELESMLGAPGYELVRTSTGGEALDRVADQDIAVILLDGRGANVDREIVRRIGAQQRFRHTPILLLADNRDQAHVVRPGHPVTIDVLYTPVEPEVLRSRVELLAGFAQNLRSLRRRVEALESRNAELEARIGRAHAQSGGLDDELRQFAYAASHDLQEPMRTIGSYTQLLQRRLKESGDADVQEFLGYIVGAVRRMGTLLNDLLVYSQVSEGKAEQIEDVDCEAVLNATLMNLNSEIRESQAEISHDPLPALPFDFARLTQVFQNLLSNAIKFHREGAAPRIRVAAAAGEDEWRFSVSDNGMGIDPRFHEQVFGVFKRLHGRQFPGTGMGLAIVRKIIERRGGRTWVESSPGGGATFYFTVPK